MPAKSGASHALAAFSSILIAATISNLLGAHYETIRDISTGIGTAVTSTIGIPLSKQVAGLLIVATLLSFVWGLAYHYGRHGGNSGGRGGSGRGKRPW